ncbi:MAG: hypothetical protein OEW67_10970 [Cyclobacteriaceae bacterium]|nr:hypothetical protein [Cyclobacteriaceae bacterium]
MKFSLPIYFLVLLLVAGCSSGKKQLERGQYYDAVIKSVNRLKGNPDHKKSKETLRSAYPFALESLEESAKQGLSTNQPNKWRNAVNQYEKLHNLYNSIKNTPGARTVITNPKSYFTELSDAKQNAAEESYNDGVILLNEKNRVSAREAFFHFQDALSFVPNYKDAVEKMEQARFDATLKVVIEQIPVPTRYKLSADFFQDKVEEFLRSNSSGSQFVAFYTPQEVEKSKLPYIDQILRIQFDDFVVGQEFKKVETETFERDSVVVGDVEMADGTIKKVYGTVKAKLIVHSKQIKSEGLVSMQIFKPDGVAILKHEKFNGTYLWLEKWATFNGDERALTKEQLQLCKRSEMYAPPPQDMFIRFTEPIYNQLTRQIRQFYSQY